MIVVFHVTNSNNYEERFKKQVLAMFKPVVDMDQLVLDRSKVGVGDHSKRQAVKHLAREKKKMDHMKRLVPNSSLLSDDNYDTEMISSSENSLVLHSSKKNLSRVIKTVFFETLLSKRVRDGKGNPCQDSNIGSKRSSSMDSKKSLDDKTNSVNKVLIETHQANEATSCRVRYQNQQNFQDKELEKTKSRT
ncbi:hypothetical protein IMY05_013G0124600 [Salix suchowensis]|nr:hypothetical protein IMY05_013G0124600 [Salix suchowensis]